MTPAAGTELAPIDLPAHDPVVDRLREIVLDERAIAAAFIYRRAPHAGAAHPTDLHALRPAVGLLPTGSTIPREQVARIGRAVGRVHGHTPTLVALAADRLDAVLQVAAPIGAGGHLERAVAAMRAGSSREHLAVAAALCDAVVTVPVPAGEERAAGPLERGSRLTLPVLLDEGRQLVAVFSSALALLHTRPPHTAAVRLPGDQLAHYLPAGVDVAVDPGLAATGTVSADLLRALAPGWRSGDR